MRRWNTPFRPRASAAALIALCVLPGAGCVLRSTHVEKVGALESEQKRLERELSQAQASNEALSAERVELLDEMEDLRLERQTLERDVAQLSRTKEILSTHLEEREKEVAELSKLSGQYEQLVADLESEVSSGQIQIEQLREGLRLNLAQDILFRSGQVTLEPYGVEVLRKVARQLTEFEQHVEVQGHSDDVPLSASLARRWGSNWELAAARASQVVRLFEAEGVDPSRLRAVSFGPYAPLASNDTAEGRARNRRIEIRLIPVDAALRPERPAEEGAASEATGDPT